MLVNVGTGNVVLQRDDMVVPHKGIPLSFRRTYNSQSLHDANGDDGTRPSLYGNGWTNTFDAHVIKTSPGHISVFDGTGARYDYVSIANTNDYAGTTPGQHAVLTWDGGCGFTWTQKSGVIYYFYRDAAPGVTCPGLGVIGGLAGRLHQIIGRNANTFVTLNYSWVNGDASLTGKISAIDVQTESGLTATMSFGDVNGHQLLMQLLFPDRTTAVTYGYDANGSLTYVTRPPNNTQPFGGSSGTPLVEEYGFGAITAWGNVGPGYILAWAASPRWWASCLNAATCGLDGGYVAFGYGSGQPLQSVTLTNSGHYGVINPVVTDATGSGPIQAGYSSAAYTYLSQYWQTGNGTPTYRDTDGHSINWIVDGSARPTQIQIYTGTETFYGGTPWDKFLTSNFSWDASNNLVATVDPGGHETDVAYDPSGNVVAIGEPILNPQTAAQYRPTQLFDYDTFNNVVAYCDQSETYPSGDWSGQYSSGSDSYCTTFAGSGPHLKFTYAYPSYEPYGELTSTVSPSGYAHTVAYDAGAQGGNDYGLPTSMSSASIQQLDGSTRQPGQFLTYDAHGNVICSRNDTATNAVTVMVYDALNRVIATADPDDASTAAACPKTPGLSGSKVVTAMSYFPDGSLATKRMPSEIAAGYATAYAYDFDGNALTEAPHLLSRQTNDTPTITRWYDSEDRLIETAEPADPSTSGDIAPLMRYAYDLSQDGSATTISGASVTAHGNLFNVRKNAPSGWNDFKYTDYDFGDRVTTDHAFAPCPAVGNGTSPPYGAIYCSQAAYATQYTWTYTSGLLSSVTDALGQQKTYFYDEENRMSGIGYAGDGGITSSKWYVYDPNGRLASASNSTADTVHPDSFVYQYSADGQLSQVRNDLLSSTTSYSYYPDAVLSGVSSTTSSLVNQPNLYQYSYRNDGLLSREHFGASNQTVSFSYTAGGRQTGMTDFGSSPSITRQYDASGMVSSYTTPAGAYTSMSYDPKGRLLQYAAFNGETVSSQYNVRGDLIGRTFQPNPVVPATGKPSYPSFQYRNIQGVLVQNTTDQYDGRTGAPLITGGTVVGYDQIGRVNASGPAGSTTYSYDAESRLVAGDTSSLAPLGDPNCATGGVGSPASAQKEVSYSYDGLGQLFRDVYRVGNSQTNRQWFWDRDRSLYTAQVDSNGGYISLDAFSADGLGSIPADGASPGLTISDIDMDGAEALHHNSTGHSAWYARGAYHQECVSANPVAASPNYIDPSSPTAPAPADDSDPAITVSSVGRGFLSKANGFTTPDYSSSTPYSTGTRHVEVDFACGAGRHWDVGVGRCIDDPPPTFPVFVGLGQPGVGGGYGKGGRIPGVNGKAPRKPVAPAQPPPNCGAVSYQHTYMPGAGSVTVCGLPDEVNKRLNCGLGAVALAVALDVVTSRVGPKVTGVSGAAQHATRAAGAGITGLAADFTCESMFPKSGAGQGPPPLPPGFTG